MNDGGTFPVVECGSAAVITSCGSQQCPDPDPFAAQSCRATCCTSDNVCGLLDASGQICVAPSFAAGGCPKVSVSLGGVSARLAGCCAASGSCGAVAFGECVEPAKLGIGEASCPGGDDAGVL